MAVAGPLVVACGSTTVPASDTGARVILTLGSGWSGTERVDHITLIATSGNQGATVCFGPAGPFQPTLSTGNMTDPCADEPSLLVSPPPMVSALPIVTKGSISADLQFPLDDMISVTAFAALAGSAVILQPIGTATGTVKSTAGYTTLNLPLTESFVPDPSCANLLFTSPAVPTSTTPCGTAGAECFAQTDKPTMDGEHDPRVTCPASGAGGFIISGTASTCPVAWRHLQTGKAGCSSYAVTLSFYRCVGGSVPDGEAEDGGSSCVRTTACTPPAVLITATLGNVSTPSPNLGVCVPPSVLPLSFTLPAAMSASLDVSVTPAATISGLAACDVEVDVLEDLSSQTLGCSN